MLGLSPRRRLADDVRRVDRDFSEVAVLSDGKIGTRHLVGAGTLAEEHMGSARSMGRMQQPRPVNWPLDRCQLARFNGFFRDEFLDKGLPMAVFGPGCRACAAQGASA